MRIGSKRVVQRVAIALFLGLAPMGCDGGAAAPVAAPPAAPAYDLEAIMRGIADTLVAEGAVLTKAERDWGAVDDDDRRAFMAAMTERRRLGDEYKAMLEANPSWATTSCDWYVSVLEKPHIDNARVQHKLHALKDTPDGRARYLQLLLDATGTKEAARAQLSWNMDHIGSPTNIAILCEKLGKLPGRGSKSGPGR